MRTFINSLIHHKILFNPPPPPPPPPQSMLFVVEERLESLNYISLRGGGTQTGGDR